MVYFIHFNRTVFDFYNTHSACILESQKTKFYLILLSILAGVGSLALPFTKFGQDFFHFSVVPLFSIFVVLVLVIFYTTLSELVKLVYFHYFKALPHNSLPVVNK